MTAFDSNQPIISLRDVGVHFSVNRNKKRSMRDRMLRRHLPQAEDQFWPFRHVSFDIQPGEAIGVIGRNGAGKSTLLSLVAGVLLPDEGVVTVNAGVAPLIQITGGFEGELSGRENIRLVAGLHGMTNQEIDQNFDDIVDFSEVGRFLDTPFKHYSNGMKVRLAFSVVSQLHEPILLVDEVLAVGDRAFKAKCLKRIDSLLADGQTLFFVSHSEGQLRRFCQRGLYLEGSALKMDGPIEDVIKQYHEDVGDLEEPGIEGEFEVDSSADESSVDAGGDDF
jgi:ABC-2 type transport system ATP-binding protein